MKRPTIEPHSGHVPICKSFEEACSYIKNNQNNLYQTGSGKMFEAKVKFSMRGENKNKKVIIFYRNNKESARSYACCWGHLTNCNRTYIDSYAKSLMAHNTEMKADE